MIELLWVLGGGILTGALIVYFLLRQATLNEARARFESWRSSDVGRIRSSALDDGRYGLKLAVGLEWSGPLDGLALMAADLRFLGDPVTFVAFDGHSEVKDRAAERLRGVVFAVVGDPRAPTPEAALVAECVAGGRLRWETLNLSTDQAGSPTSASPTSASPTSSSAPVSTS